LGKNMVEYEFIHIVAGKYEKAGVCGPVEKESGSSAGGGSAMVSTQRIPVANPEEETPFCRKDVMVLSGCTTTGVMTPGPVGREEVALVEGAHTEVPG
jgi:hypothetical protein